MIDSLQQVGLDEDPTFDAAIVEVGTSQSQRDRSQLLRDIVGDLADEHKPGAQRSDVIQCVKEEGIDLDPRRQGPDLAEAPGRDLRIAEGASLPPNIDDL